MSRDVVYYIAGFSGGPARENPKVIAASQVLSYDSDYRMRVSDTLKIRFIPQYDDGYCVVDSLARAWEADSKEQVEEQLTVLKGLFPGHAIYMSDDYYEREEVISAIAEKFYENVGS